MAELHTNLLSRALYELSPGESHAYDFPDKKTAHNEYCAFRNALRSAAQRIPAAKSLSLSREGNTIFLSMSLPPHSYPAPRTVSFGASQKEESKNDLSVFEKRIEADLAEGLLSFEDAQEMLEELKAAKSEKKEKEEKVKKGKEEN